MRGRQNAGRSQFLADALRRRLGPTWPPAALRYSGFGLVGLCDAALGITAERVVQRRRLLLPLRLLCLLRLLRFLRHVALQAMMSGDVGTMHIRIDVHRTPITTAPNEKLRISLTKSERRRRTRDALLD